MDVVISYNSLKHHLNYIIRNIKEIRSEADLEELTVRMKRIGNSTLDLYLGELTINAMEDQICSLLKSKNNFEPLQFRRWIRQNNGYRTIKLSDNSGWTLLPGNKIKYIHVHPSRYSKHTIRTHGSTLKTVIAVTAWCHLKNLPVIPDHINYVRKTFIDLPPVKSLTKNKGILKVLKLFENKL